MKFLFDLGGIFFNWDPYHYYKDIFSNRNELNYFLNNVCNDDWNYKQDAGRLISDAELDLISKFPQYTKQIKLYYPNHRKMIKNIFKESVEQLEELKSNNFFCYALSNWSSETFIGMTDDYNFLNKFDGMIISGNEKLVKPNKEIYNLAIKRFNLIPNQTVFIDDKLENIRPAKLLGFNVIHLEDPKLIKHKIRKYTS